MARQEQFSLRKAIVGEEHTVDPMIWVARLIGVLFHPVVVAVPVAAAIVYHELGAVSVPLIWFAAITFFATIGVPVAIVAALYQAGFIGTDVFFRNQENRKFVYPIIMAVMVVDALLYKYMFPFPVGAAIAWAGALAGLLLFVGNFFTKVSFHAAGVACLTMSGIMLYGKEALLLVPALPMVAWARVRAQKHTPLQVVLGFGVGTLSAVVVILLAYPEFNKLTQDRWQGYSSHPPEYWLPFSGRPDR